ncbi:MAG: type II secretion system protein N [Hydrogenophaga sp.]
MVTSAVTRLAWLGLVLGLLMAVLLFAPARWLADALTQVSGQRLQLVNARGTVWSGQADLLLTGGDGSRGETVLPQGVRWRLRPAWADAGPAAQIDIEAPCCTSQALQLTVRPGWQRLQLTLAPFQSQWPTDLLTGLGTPWNTLRFEGRLQLASPGLTLQWSAGRSRLQGALELQVHDLTSRLSTVRPLGSYRCSLDAPAGSDGATLSLHTLSGDLQVQGQGQWTAGRLHFRGEASALPGREAALANLLNIVGRRQGERSLLSVG